MVETFGLTPGQQDALLALLRALADAELVTEETRCRLCETCSFDPTSAWKGLQGVGALGAPRSWVSVREVHAWLAGQPHAVASVGFEELGDLFAQFGASNGEVRLEDFHRLVLPRNPANECLRRLALSRGAESSWLSAGSEAKGMSPEAAYRFCQLLDGELTAAHKLKFLRMAMRDQAVHHDSVLRFLDSEQGLCAGMGGLLSPDGVRAFLADRLRALSRPQVDALLRRASVNGAAFFPFDDLARCLLPRQASLAPVHAARPTSPHATKDAFGATKDAYGTSRYGVTFDTSADGPPRLTPWASQLDTSLSQSSLFRPSVDMIGGVGQSALMDRSAIAHTPTVNYSPLARSRESLVALGSPGAAPRLQDVGGPSSLPASRPLRATSPSTPNPGWRGLDGGARARSASRGRMADTTLLALPGPASRLFAATAPAPRSPRGECGVASPMRTPLRDTRGAAGGYALQEATRSSSIPAGARDTRHASMMMSPQALMHMSPPLSSSSPPQLMPRKDEARERLAKAVAQVMAKQASLDAEFEDAKAQLPPACTLESAFASLDRMKKGYVSAADARALMEDFGTQLAVTDFGAIVREVRLRWSWDDPAAATLLVQERLSLCDLGLLLCASGSQELAAVRAAKSDDDLRSALYLLRFSEPCPRCGIRVQRDADAAGCPTVTCSVCGTAFRCFCVVGDHSLGAAALGPAPLPMAARFQLTRLLSIAARAAGEAERERKKLALLTTYDTCGLADVFNMLAGSQVGFTLADLRRTLYQWGVPLTERELGLLWQRYAPSRGGAVSMPDFRRQLQPMASWLTGA